MRRTGGSHVGGARSPSAPGLCWDSRHVSFVVRRLLPDRRARRARPTNRWTGLRHRQFRKERPASQQLYAAPASCRPERFAARAGRQGLPPSQFQIGRVINREPMPGGKLGDGEKGLPMRFFIDGQACSPLSNAKPVWRWASALVSGGRRPARSSWRGPPIPRGVRDSANWQTGGRPHKGRNENCW